MIELVEAIKGKRLISFMYSGKKRKAEVYTLGVSPAGELLVRCFERPSRGWKLFKVNQMSKVELLNQTFYYVRSGYNRSGDAAMTEILAKI